MSMQSPVGTLDIKNATLRVGKLEVSNVQGIDTALNVTRANSVLVYDDQVSTTTFSGFTSTAGVRDTGNGYLNIAGGHVYWGQKLPNSWVMDFEMDIRSGTSAGPLYANVFSTTNTGGDGYSFTFNDNNDKITLKYDGTTLAEATVSGLFTASENWQKVVINYERGLIAISVDGSRKFYYKDIERSTPYVNGEYINFSSASTDGRKIRDLRIVNGEKWVYSGESNVAFTQGSVGVGVSDPAYTLDVGGDINLSGSFYQGGSPFVSSLWTDGANSLYYRSNVEVGTGNLFVDTTTSNVGIRTTTPAYELDVAGNVNAHYFLGDGSQLTGIATDLESVSNIGNTTSNTIQFTNATTGFVTESNVGIANTNPQNDLDVGSNLSVLDAGSNVLSVRGNVNATSITIGDFQIVSAYGLDHVTNENNQTTDTIISTNATTGFQATSNIVAGDTVQANKIVSTSNLEVGTANLFVDTTTSNVGIGTNAPDYELDVVGNVNATYLIGDGSAISAIQSSNVTDFASNVSRITALESSRALESDLDNNSSRITIVSSNLSDNSSRITALESGDTSISGDKTFTGDVIFESNIHMNGNVLVANTINMTVSDPIIELGSNNLNTNDLGIIMTRHGATNSNVAFVYDEDVDILRMGYTLNGANDSIIDLDSNALAVSVQGALSAASVSGDGSGLSQIQSSNVSDFASNVTRIENLESGDLTISGEKTFSSNLEVGTANLFVNTTTGNVGIGTSSPSHALNVRATSGDAAVHIQAQGNAGDSILYFNGAPANQRKCAIISSNVAPASYCKQDLHFCMETTSDASDVDITDSKMVLTNAGNVGIGTASPGIILDVGASLANPQIGRNYAVGGVHDTDKRDAIYFGRWDGTGRDFLGMKCRVDTHTNLGYGAYSNQSKIEFYTWGNNYASSREVMCIRGDGNVGIGTTSPGVQLHIQGTSPRTLSTSNGPSYSDYGQLVITDTTAPSATGVLGNLKIGFDASTGSFGTGFLQCVNPNTYTGPLVLQPYGGNVGVGTATPDGPLHIFKDGGNAGQVGGGIIMERNYNYGCAIWSEFPSGGTVDCMNFRCVNNATDAYGGTPQMVLTHEGRVGIGTASPVAKLDVIGSINNGTYGANSGYMADRTLAIGSHGSNYGGGTGGWNTNTAGFLMECLDTTEMAVHDSGTRVASFMYFQGGSTNKFTIGRNMGWGTTNVEVAGVLKNNNPAFYAQRTSNISGNNVIIWNAQKQDRTNNYNTSNGRFTAPIAGYYFFSFWGLSNGSVTTHYDFKKNGSTVHNAQPYSRALGDMANCSGTIVVELAVNDYVSVWIRSGTMYGGGNDHNGFCGYLIG